MTEGWNDELTDWLSHWLIDWLTDRLTDCLLVRLNYSLKDWCKNDRLTNRLVVWRNAWLTDWKTDTRNDALNHWLSDWCNDCLIDWLIKTKRYDGKLVLVNGLFLSQCTPQVRSKFNMENNQAPGIVTQLDSTSWHHRSFAWRLLGWGLHTL